MDKKTYIDILNSEMQVATGCTEPAAVSFAGSVAANELKKLGDKILEIKTRCSRNILKNAMSAGLPSTDKVGVKYAVGIGALYGNPIDKLDVNKNAKSSDYDAVEKMIKENKISVEVSTEPNVLFIEVVVIGEKHKAKTIIADEHTNVVLIEVDDKVIFENTKKVSSEGITKDFIDKNLTIDGIYNFCDKELDVKNDPIDIVRKAVELNSTIGEAGLKKDYGLAVGRHLKNRIEKGEIGKDNKTNAIIFATAGADARMAGAPFAVVTNSGSGNQGITITNAVCGYAREIGASEEKMMRAVTLAHLSSIKIKSRFGTLSAFCGAAIASMGACCGITYLMGGTSKEISYAIQNMIGTVAGMICDGAKADCSLKIYAGLQAAFESAYLAMDGIRVEATDGIVCEDVQNSINNIGRLSTECSNVLDENILQMMLNK